MAAERRIFRSGWVLGATFAAVGVVVALGFVYLWELPKSVHVALPLADDAVNSPVESPAFAFLEQPRDLPDLRFVDEAGRSHSLAALRGHPLVLNIWATWCVPCRKEMPTLDHLQTILAGTDALVVPLSIDSTGPSVVIAFYREIGIRSLGIYVDSSGATASTVATVGVPTTLLVDRNGREIGRKLGAAVWDSADMVSLIRSHLAPKPARPGADQRP